MHIQVVLVHAQYNFSPYLSLLSDLRLAIHLLLHSEFEAAVAVLAVVCSSMVPVNRASTGRSFLTPLGNEYFLPVRKSNKLTSRRGFHVGLCLKTHTLFGTKNSLLGFYFTQN